MAEQLSEIGSEIVDRGNSQHHGAASEMSQQVGRYVHDFVQILEDFTHYLRNTDAAQIKADVQERVRENPLGTIAIGIGIGFLLGKIIR